MIAAHGLSRIASSLAAAACLLACTANHDSHAPPPSLPADVLAKLEALSPSELPAAPHDPTNQWADDPAAAALGKKLFFEPRFSGPLVADDNQGTFSGALGLVGETGKVSCSGCHVPAAGYLDNRSPFDRNSLAAGWTRRRAPSLLDEAQATFLNWDGHRDTAFGQVFTPIEDPLEFNSSRLYVAQQVARLYKDDYEAIFGPLPPGLAAYDAVLAADAGCNDPPATGAHGTCDKIGHDDPDVTRVVVNVGKAISAYTRKLTCGPSRFDAWVAGDASALTPQEQAGAVLFVGKAGCNACHTGPYLTDQRFHNVGVGLPPGLPGIPAHFQDPGASDGLAAALADPLSSKGAFSDGDDGRADWVDQDTTKYLGAFRTPTLRCVSRRPSLLHAAQIRTLEDAVVFFTRGGAIDGYVGVSENAPRDLSDADQAALVAFLRALDGKGPSPDLLEAPDLPADSDAGP